MTEKEYNPEADPKVDEEVISKHIGELRKNPKGIGDPMTFLLIEQCNEWHAEYRRQVGN